MSDKRYKAAEMTDAVMDEMRLIVRDAMGLCPGRSVKEQISYAARELGIEFRRLRGIYYREARAILAHEADRLRAWHHDHIQEEEKRLETRAAELRARRAALRERLDDLDAAVARQRELRFG